MAAGFSINLVRTFPFCVSVIFLLHHSVCSSASPTGPIDDSLGSHSPLSLQAAVETGLREHPKLKSLPLQIKAAEARESQASAYPNPEAGVDLENLLGNKTFAGFGGMEATARIGQPISLGGKRLKRLEVATQEHHLAELEFQRARERVNTHIQLAFEDGLVAQSQVLLQEENVRLDSAFLNTTLARRSAGVATLLEEEKARMIMSQGRLGLKRANRAMARALRRLAAEMGRNRLDTLTLKGSLDSIPLEPLEEYQKRWETHPAQQVLSQEGRIRTEELALLKAERIPDLRLDVGVRRSNEADAYALVFGASIPLPLWNRNAGGVREAELLVDQARADSVAETLRWSARLEDLYATLSGAEEEARSLKEKVIPAGEKAYAAAREGHAIGRFSYLEVLDAQKTLFEAKSQYLNALADFHKARIALEGGPDEATPFPFDASPFISSSQQSGLEHE